MPNSESFSLLEREKCERNIEEGVLMWQAWALFFQTCNINITSRMNLLTRLHFHWLIWVTTSSSSSRCKSWSLTLYRASRIKSNFVPHKQNNNEQKIHLNCCIGEMIIYFSNSVESLVSFLWMRYFKVRAEGVHWFLLMLPSLSPTLNDS